MAASWISNSDIGYSHAGPGMIVIWSAFPIGDSMMIVQRTLVEVVGPHSRLYFGFLCRVLLDSQRISNCAEVCVSISVGCFVLIVLPMRV